MSRKPSSLFVEREVYRKRRMIDAARVLPILGAALFLLPVLWRSPEGLGLPTTHLMGYLFGIWLLLTVGAAALSSYIASIPEPDEDPPEARG